MSGKLTKFYDFLMDRQRTGKRFTIDEAVEATGYAVSSFRAAISKHLKGRWVEAVDGQHFVVHDFASVSPAVFAEAMSQNTRLTFADESEWRAQVRRLLALGVQQGYQLRPAIDAVLRQIEAEGR